MRNKFYNIWPFLVVVVVWAIFASPFLFRGKIPFTGSYQVNNFAPWSAYPQFASPVKNPAMPDVITQIYPWKHFTIQTYKMGQIPFWNPYSFSGTPHLANYQSAVLSPFNLLFFVMPFVDAWGLLVLLQPLLAGIFMLLFMRKISISNSGALIGSIAFMFCGFITTWMGYATLGYAILFLPLALFAIEWFLGSKSFWALTLFSITFPLSFFSGHFQISLYFLLATILYLIYKLFTSSKSQVIILFVFAFLGMLLTLPQLFPTIEFYQQSLRSNLFQQLEAIPWNYFPTFLAPDFFGNPVTRNEWFGHYAEWNAFFGVIPLILAFLSFRIKSIQVYFFGGLALFSLLLAFPTPLLSLMIALHIPVLSTSAASRIIVLFSFSAAVLSGIGFDELCNIISSKNKKPLYIWIGISIFAFLVLWIVVLRHVGIPLEDVGTSRQNLLFPTAIFIGALGVIAIAWILQKKLNKKVVFMMGICLLILVSVDMLRFAMKWQEFSPKQLVFPSVGVTGFFNKISGFDRVFGNIGGEATIYYSMPSVEGYDALYIRRYGQLVGSISTGKLTDSARSVVLFPKSSANTAKALNLLNISYIIQKTSDDNMVWSFPYWIYPNGQFPTLYNDGVYKVFKNTKALPHAYLVANFIMQSNLQKEVNTIFSKDFNPATTVILEKDLTMQGKLGTGSAVINSYTPDIVTITTNATKPSLLVLTDTFYPGWKVTVDGKPVEILRANVAFRGVLMPAGKHTVVFSYFPQSFTMGIIGALLGILGIIGGTVFLKITTRI